MRQNPDNQSTATFLQGAYDVFNCTVKYNQHPFSLILLNVFTYTYTKMLKFPMSCRNVKVKLYLCFADLALCHEGVCGSGCIDPHFLDLGPSWR
jgi:hypothetical protein